MFSGWGACAPFQQITLLTILTAITAVQWPVEHGSFAMGMMRSGLIEELRTIARAIFEVSTLFDYNRLPECCSGHPRDGKHPFPGLYPKTNWPQAWSASSVFAILQAILGIYPFAPTHLLLLDLLLPDWLPEIFLRNLRVGKAVVSIHFYRRGMTTRFDVIKKQGDLHVLRQPSPWSLTAGVGEICWSPTPQQRRQDWICNEKYLSALNQKDILRAGRVSERYPFGTCKTRALVERVNTICQ